MSQLQGPAVYRRPDAGASISSRLSCGKLPSTQGSGCRFALGSATVGEFSSQRGASGAIGREANGWMHKKCTKVRPQPHGRSLRCAAPTDATMREENFCRLAEVGLACKVYGRAGVRRDRCYRSKPSETRASPRKATLYIHLLASEVSYPPTLRTNCADLFTWLILVPSSERSAAGSSCSSAVLPASCVELTPETLLRRN